MVATYNLGSVYNELNNSPSVQMYTGLDKQFLSVKPISFNICLGCSKEPSQ